MDNEAENLDSINEEQETTNSSNGNEEGADTTDNAEQEEEYTPREKQYYARIKKLEAEVQAARAAGAPKQEAPKITADGLTATDILALQRANIDPEDLDDVLEYARFKKAPIVDVLRSSVLKATLADNAERRKSAEAVNTGTARRPGSVISDDKLIENARNGIMPSSDDDLRRLASLRLKGKK